ncbi:TetR/AcrR family transcriptional regulator [Amaricoccus macauensis]|uniref:TetR/AcrR family transcriptional regulator n=1 Tax=Amaricoccus macauensis TaxID=57001 RepID=UPI003C7B3B50
MNAKSIFSACTCTEPSTNRRRGRPPPIDPGERKDLILDAMERVLTQKGLRGATMAAIACEARMSKRTIYEVFGDREALFTACVRRRRADFMKPIEGDDCDLPLEERLCKLLRPRGKEQTTPACVLRAVIAEAPDQPEMARSFLREGPMAIQDAITEELDRAVSRGEIRIQDTKEAARFLSSLVFSNPIEKLVAPELLEQTEAQIEARVRRGVKIFLGGIEAAGA